MTSHPTIYRFLTVLALAGSLEAMPQWSESSLSMSRRGLVGCSAGTKVLFSGGDTFGSAFVDRVDIYDVSTNSWSLAQLSLPRHALSATAVGDRILIAGGQEGNGWSDVVDIYNSTNGHWGSTSLSLPRGGMGAGTVAGLAFFAGGINSSGPSDRVDIFSSSTGTWSTATLSQARSGPKAVTLGAKIWFVGGSAYPAGMVDAIDVYDSATGSWSTSQLPAAAAFTGSATVGDLAFFCKTGGEVWIYDDSAGTWTITTLSQPRHGVAMAAVDSRVLFAGGFDGPEVFDTVDIYDTATGAWQVAALSTTRDSMASTALGGQAFFGGGFEDIMSVSDLVHIYTPGPGHSFCAGDGLGGPCPCSNDGPAGRGCVNSKGESALLASFNSASVSSADLGFTLTGAVPGETALLFAARNAVNGGLGIAFGDGLRCAGGAAVRLDLQVVDGNGTVVWDPAPYGGWSPGNVRRFQVYYGDPTGPCGSTFNLSNGVEVQFVP